MQQRIGARERGSQVRAVTRKASHVDPWNGSSAPFDELAQGTVAKEHECKRLLLPGALERRQQGE